MPDSPTRLLRGPLKFVAVMVAAGLVGVGAGVGLAKLTGEEESRAPEASAPAATSTTAAATTTTAAASTTPETTTARAARVFREPGVEVLSAAMGTASPASGSAPVTVRVRVTNRNAWALRPRAVAFVAGSDEVPLDGEDRRAAGPLLRPIAAHGRATGELRFTLPPDVVQRVLGGASPRIQVGGRTVTLTELTIARAVE